MLETLKLEKQNLLNKIDLILVETYLTLMSAGAKTGCIKADENTEKKINEKNTQHCLFPVALGGVGQK